MVEWIKSTSPFITIIIVLIAAGQVFVNWIQYVESRQKRIEAEEVLKQANSILNSTKIKSEQLQEQVVNTTKQLSEITKTINSVEQKTQNALKTSIAKIDEQILQSKNRLLDAESTFNEKTNNITKSLKQLELETEQSLRDLQWRDNLMLLTDQAISHSKRDSYDKIWNLYINEVDEKRESTILSYILQIKSFYIGGKRYLGSKAFEHGKEINMEDFDTAKLIINLKSNNECTIRTKAARVLGNRKETDVPEALMEAVMNDTCLDVIAQSADSFSNVTGFEKNDVFSIDKIQPYWAQHRAEILKKMKPTQDVELFKKVIHYDTLLENLEREWQQ